MFKGLFILGANNYERIYGPAEQRDIRQLVDIYAPPQTPDDVKANPAILQDADVIFSGWGGPRMDADFLAAAPNLMVLMLALARAGWSSWLKTLASERA